MQPTSRALIEAIISAIDETIMPAVSDKQAASSLRAARTLLDHLAVRVEVEGALIADELAEAEPLLAALGVTLREADRANRHAVSQQIVDDMLRAMPAPGFESDAQADVRTTLRAYLKRSLARERAQFFPAFLGPPF